MNFIMQRSWHTQVMRSDHNTLKASCHYLDTNEEKIAVLNVSIENFNIEKAELVQLGSPGEYQEKTITINEIQGIPAYLGIGPQLRQALAPLLPSRDRELFNQCIIGLFQAETFLYRERGFDSAEIYTQAGEKYLQGTCRYYSNLNLVTRTWSQYIGQQKRQIHVFDRFKSQQLIEDNDQYLLAGSLNDTFHQLTSLLRIGIADGCVRQAEGALLRAPDQICRQSSSYLRTLVGLNFLSLNKKSLAQQLGAGNGCVHLIDLIYDSAETLKMLKE